MSSIYQILKQIPSQIFLFFMFISIYFVGVNFFTVKFTPIFYLTHAMIAVYFRKENKFYIIYPFVFIIGMIDDIVYSRILGASSIFNILYLNTLNVLMNKFIKNLARYLILNIGLVFYFFYQVLSLIYLRGKYYMPLLYGGDVLLLQIFAFLGMFIFQSILYLKRDLKNNVKERLIRVTNL